MGHNVLTAEDGNQAMEIAQDHTVDLVLSDVDMPNMSGPVWYLNYVVLRIIKKPIVMVTTESDGYKKCKLKSLGANS